MQDAQVLIGLLVAVALLAPLAGVLRVPYPILLVLGGLAQEMRKRGDLDGEVLRRIEHDLDLEESRLED